MAVRSTRRRSRSTSDPVPRKQPQQQRAAETVHAIVTAVERVLHAHGAKGLTTNRIAEVAGVSVGTLYQYFPNKQALVGALQERVLSQLLDTFRAGLEAGAKDSMPALATRIAASMVAVYQSQLPVHHWLIELRSEAVYQERFQRAVDEFVDVLAAYFERRTDVEFSDKRATAFATVLAVEGIANGVAARPGKIDVAAVAAEGARMIGGFFQGRERR
jgi:AcrR family transcriptional regulator